MHVSHFPIRFISFFSDVLLNMDITFFPYLLQLFTTKISKRERIWRKKNIWKHVHSIFYGIQYKRVMNIIWYFIFVFFYVIFVLARIEIRYVRHWLLYMRLIYVNSIFLEIASSPRMMIGFEYWLNDFWNPFTFDIRTDSETKTLLTIRMTASSRTRFFLNYIPFFSQ